MTVDSAELRVFSRPSLVRGRPTDVDCVVIGGQTYSLTRGPVTVLGLEDEWYEDVRDPERVIDTLRRGSPFKPDIFTFWQRVPDLEPRYPYHLEWDEIAVLPVQSYDHWWQQRIKSRVRSLIRKAEREGLVVRETEYDDEFVKGMTAIFNESPVRQGRPFWHFGKDFETVRQQFSRYVHRERMIGAYLDGEMIGLVMLGDAGRFAVTGQIIASLKHRDKAVSNALIAKAVEICAARGLGHLIYLFWGGDDSLTEFKRRCGFECTRVPRYHVPLTTAGALALRCGAHRGWKAVVPNGLKAPPLKRLRQRWYGRQEHPRGAAPAPLAGSR